MMRHTLPLALVLAMAMAADGIAQVRVQTESIKRSDPADASGNTPESDAKSGAKSGAKTDPKSGPSTTGSVSTTPTQREEPTPELIFDFSRLPEPVLKTRERLLAVARAGDLNELAKIMQANGTPPIFSLNDDKDPISFWKANYPDSDGVEVLSILIEILESGVVHVDKGTPQDMYVWPYFARMPLKALNASQKVELFKIITGTDYKDMLKFGAYNFYRLGISPDGNWQFFVAGD